MPIRSNFVMALTLTGAIACGLAIKAHAQSPGLIHLAQQDDDDDDRKRDLRPVPSSKGRPRVTLIPSAKVVPIGGWVNFRVGSSVTGYGHIYVMSASGRAQVWMENVPIVRGQRLVFPIGRIGIRAAAPAGREDLMLIVTKKRINGFFGYDTTRTTERGRARPQELQGGADGQVHQDAEAHVEFRAHLGSGRGPLVAHRSRLGLGQDRAQLLGRPV